MSTITPHDDGASPVDPSGPRPWWLAILNVITPAIYETRWAPWIRMVLTVIVFASVTIAYVLLTR